MSLAKKMNLKPGMKMLVVGKPSGVKIGDIPAVTSGNADSILVFVTTLQEVDANCRPVVEAAKADGLAWIAYPKAGQLNTDLNRDILWKHLLEKEGIQGVRQVAIDDTWSALRFRPGK